MVSIEERFFDRPVIALTASSVLLSVFPLVVFYAGPQASVLAYTAALELVSSVLMLVGLALSARRILDRKPRILSALLPPSTGEGPGPVMLWMLLAMTGFNLVWYALASRLVPLPVVVFTVEGIRPLALAAMLGMWGKAAGRFLTPTNAVAMVVMGVAAGVIVSSQTSGTAHGGAGRIAAGVLLAAITAALYAVRPVAAVLYGDRSVPDVAAPADARRRLWWTVFATAASGLASSMALTVAGVAGAVEDVSLRVVVIGAAAGVPIGAGMFLVRAGSASSSDTRWHAVLYGTPVLSVLWLWAAGEQIARPVQYAIAATVIVCLNVVTGTGVLDRR